MEEALTGRHPLPHITVLVDVDEGRRVVDRSVLAHPDEVSIGMVVRAISKRSTDTVTLPGREADR